MWISCVFCAVFGYVFNVVLAYVVTDIDSVFSSPLGQPLGAILQMTLGDGGFTKFLWLCTVISNFGVVFVMNTSGTRIYFAYARDGALPFSSWLSRVNRVTKTPVNATIALCTIFCLIGLISLGSSVALHAFFSGASMVGATSYMMPILMRLVDPHIRHDLRTNPLNLLLFRCLYEDNPDYVPGPFSLGKWSRPVRTVAVIWTCKSCAALSPSVTNCELPYSIHGPTLRVSRESTTHRKDFQLESGFFRRAFLSCFAMVFFQG
jgi:hypothetical protein